ncbi:MAG: DUF488 domain-containing protein [Chloroflexi bacterium]|nr:DUF488 domain-containing protein [Chloroflexota bacterium]
MAVPVKPAALTIGHSNHSLGDFLTLLKKHRADLLVDVRSHPRSKYANQFDSPGLGEALEQAGIRYLYLGDELGGRPRDSHYYDSAGYVLYGKLAQSDDFFRGLVRLRGELPRHRVAIMCSEEDPTNCHRRLLVGRVLAERGHSVNHIRGDGRLQSEQEIAQSERGGQSAQMSLLQPDEEESWRSARPIRLGSPSTAPGTFSSP